MHQHLNIINFQKKKKNCFHENMTKPDGSNKKLYWYNLIHILNRQENLICLKKLNQLGGKVNYNTLQLLDV